MRSIVFATLVLYACSPKGDGGCTPNDREVGDRAKNGCPQEESCSDATPDGLIFKSQALPTTPFLTALGGKQTFVVQTPDEEAFTLPFEIDFRDIDGSSPFTIGDVDGQAGTFALHGAAPGVIWVNLREPSTHRLYDRVSLEVQEVQDLEINLPQFFATAVYSPSEIDVQGYVASTQTHDGFFGPVPNQLADENLVLEVQNPLFPRASAIVDGTQTDWDTLHLVTSKPGPFTLVARRGNELGRATFTATDHVIEVQLDAPPRVVVGETTSVCALATWDGPGLVVGVPYEVTVTGPIQVTRPGECFEIEGMDEGPASLTIREPDGITRSVIFPVQKHQ